jgi:hypothetical protein
MVPLIGVAIFAIVRGVSFKNFSVNVPKGTTTGDDNSTDVLLLLEALKIKDDLAVVNRIVLQRQKRRAREAINTARDIQLHKFREVVYKGDLDTEDEQNEFFILTDSDYLFYALMLEQMYTKIFAAMMDAFEENGLAAIENPHEYADRRAATLLWQVGVNGVINAFYPGISRLPRSEHDKMFKEIEPKLLKTLRDVHIYAISVAQSGQRKKTDLKTFLFDKVDQMQGISRDQIKSFFSDVMPEDFLNV